MKNTTPYYNCSTENLAKKVNEISEAIENINKIPAEYLDFLDAYSITNLLVELKKCVIREIENRRA